MEAGEFVTGDPAEGTTWLFTKNGPSEVPMNEDPIDLDENEVPFGDNGMVAVLKGGSAFSLKGKQLTGQYMNPAQDEDADLAVVDP